MRRYVQILGLVVLALAASGWGSIVAAVLCPHANSSALKQGAAESMAVEQACHAVKPETLAKPDCHDSDTEQPEAAAGTDATETPREMPVAARYGGPALALPQNVPCTHCLSRPEVPTSTVIARQQAEPKRSLEPVAGQALTLAIPRQSFAMPVLYRQGAPPGSFIPKHLLTGILLI
jgi:hypothetical protein